MIGDSTSYVVALALDSVASADLEVVWAGQSNCGLSPAYEVRWWGSIIVRSDECPSVDRTWPEVVESFDPDVILAIASLPELAEQRYVPDDDWHRPGSGPYRIHHELGGDGLAALAAEAGAVVLLADAPAFGDHGFGNGPLGEPDRLAAGTRCSRSGATGG